MNASYSPDTDGVDHIRLSEDGKTVLGRALYIGAHRPIADPEYGHFNSVIAFWVWFDGGRHDALRNIHHGAMLRSSLSGVSDTPGNRQEVIKVLKRSILTDLPLKELLARSDLPFAAYEAINFKSRQEPAVYPIEDRLWYVAGLEQIRAELKGRVG